MQRYYDVHGLQLAIFAEGFAERNPIEGYVAPFATRALPAVDYRIEIHRGRVCTPPAGSAILFEGGLLSGLPARVVRAGTERWIQVADLLSVCSDHERRTCIIWAGEGCSSALLGYAGIHAIDAALTGSGQYLVHGAALAMPGPSPKALLLFAPSGTGKTTAALALALRGFGLMTDDAVVLQPRGYRGTPTPHVWGLPRPLKVHRNTAALLPTLLPALGENWDEAGEQPLTLAAAAEAVNITGAAAATLPVCCVLMLGPRSDGAHCVAPMEKARALLLLSQDNLRHAPGDAGPEQALRFRALAELLTLTPAYSLNIGAPLMSLADRVEAHLAAGIRI